MMLTGKIIADARFVDRVQSWMILLRDTKNKACEYAIDLTTILAIGQRKAAETTSGRMGMEPEPLQKELGVPSRKRPGDSLLLAETAIPLSYVATSADATPVRLIRNCNLGSVGVQPGLSEGHETWLTFNFQAALGRAAGARRARATHSSPILFRLPYDPARVLREIES